MLNYAPVRRLSRREQPSVCASLSWGRYLGGSPAVPLSVNTSYITTLSTHLLLICLTHIVPPIGSDQPSSCSPYSSAFPSFLLLLLPINIYVGVPLSAYDVPHTHSPVCSPVVECSYPLSSSYYPSSSLLTLSSE